MIICTVCHLVDSRVGLQKTDLELFELIAESGFAGDVIIVLTQGGQEERARRRGPRRCTSSGAGGARRFYFL